MEIQYPPSDAQVQSLRSKGDKQLGISYLQNFDSYLMHKIVFFGLDEHRYINT